MSSNPRFRREFVDDAVALVSHGILSINEARELLNIAPVSHVTSTAETVENGV